MFFLILLDADCSGRMLATVLVAWVTTAMIASILLQWEHMWIVLVILTLLFFMVCGYTVYTVKRTHARIIIEQQRAAIRTISDITANRRQQAGSSPYMVHLTPDLPPSYASVVTVQEASTRASNTDDSLGQDKFEDPPPYSIVIASTNVQEQNTEISAEEHVPPPAASTRKDDATISTISTSALVFASHTCPNPS
ncbi:uncharacterized protein LOC105200370 [Solenopsis invicta]|uniref:uncharacterized protein LOC105200370 n=1 Tax=Solenopsis invicta TaxID=13686 RepID=UPI000595B86F|nr:uncharacterized protein LOC105200370 [Solenopsis invicta]